MNQLLTSVGLGDGQGNVSSTRVVLYVVILCILAPATYVAFKTGTPLALTDQNLTLVGMAFGTKLFQNQQEKTDKPATPTA